MKRLPLALIIVGPMLMIITVGFGAFGLYADHVGYESRVADVDAELVRAGATRYRILQEPKDDRDEAVTVGDTPFEPPVQLYATTDGDVVAVGQAANPFDPATMQQIVQVDGFRDLARLRYRVLVEPAHDGLKGITALPLGPVDEAVAVFRRHLAIGGASIVVAQGLVIATLVRRVVRPVARMSRSATRIADGELHTTVGPPAGSRETAALAVDLERVLGRLRSTLVASEESAAEAVQARHDMQRFLADLSHEVRTPLTALRGYSDLYVRGMLDEPGALDRAMERIGDESERLRRLVDHMLQLARKHPTNDHLERFDPVSVVADVVTDLRSSHPDRPIELSNELPEVTLLAGVRGEFHQAVLNIGSNACTHTSAPDPVEVRIRSDGTDVVIEMIDHGPGIAPEFADQVLLPFFRIDSSRTRGTGGAGLGLALTKQIVDRHGGRILITETPGGGATFRLVFPRAPSTSP